MDKHLHLNRIQEVPSFPKKFISVSDRRFSFDSNDIYRQNRRKEFYLGDNKIDKIQIIDKMELFEAYKDSGLSKRSVSKRKYFSKIWQKEGFFFKYVKEGCSCGDCVKYFCVYVELEEGAHMPFKSYGIGCDKYGKSLSQYRDNIHCHYLTNSGNSSSETFRATIFDMCVKYIGMDL